MKFGGVLLSHTVSSAVPSALRGLTTRFGMDTGCFPPRYDHRNRFRAFLAATAVNSVSTPHLGVRATWCVCGLDAWCVLSVLCRGVLPGNRTVDACVFRRFVLVSVALPQWVLVVSLRPISTGQLHTLRCFHIRPINPVVCWGPLPTMWDGNLILKQASRLDAFSGYPFRT